MQKSSSYLQKIHFYYVRVTTLKTRMMQAYFERLLQFFLLSPISMSSNSPEIRRILTQSLLRIQMRTCKRQSHRFSSGFLFFGLSIGLTQQIGKQCCRFCFEAPKAHTGAHRLSALVCNDRKFGVSATNNNFTICL